MFNEAFKFSVCHPEVFWHLCIEYTNVSVYHTTIYFIYFKIVYLQSDMFRSSLGPALKKQIQDYIDFFLQKRSVGSQMLTECYKGTV